MTRHLRYALAIVAVVIFGALFFYADHLTREEIGHNARITGLLLELGLSQKNLEEQVLGEAFFAYPNHDDVVATLRRSRELYTLIEHELAQAGLLQGDIRNQMATLKSALEKREEQVYRFQTLNAVIKNSALQIPRLVRRYLEQRAQPDLDYLKLLARIAAEVTLGKGSLDPDLMPDLERDMQALQQWPLANEQARRFNDIFLRHAQTIYRHLPEYSRLLEQTRSMPIREYISRLQHSIEAQTSQRMQRIRELHFFLTLAFAAAVLIIIALMIRTHRENLRLQRLQEHLRLSALTDPLTGLGNRRAFSESRVSQPVLLLINIDRFKHINDFYGVAAGDSVIQQLVHVLRHELNDSLQQRLFRISGDDFAILLSAEDKLRPDVLAQQIINTVERHAFVFEGNSIPVSVSIGLSREEPLLETADLALRAVKKTRGHYMEYHSTAGLEEGLEENLRMIQIIRDAVRDHRVVPFFQPLLNNRSGLIDKYECLMRIRLPDDEYLTPDRFLGIAREARLSGELTRSMIEACLTRFMRNDLNFSINLSMDDMLDSTVTSYLFYELEQQPELARRMTVEILETEEIDDYETARSFISHIRRLGCSIAIDDFGSGYSNLRKVLDLDIDQLKIDASLIRELGANPQAEETVYAILQFTRAAKIPSVVAEFVHSEAVQKIVVRMGIDYSQGYWIGRPEPELPGDT
ncbi:MAG: EAL domain-containing protein [Gammaproteobacteria bacterium]|nr:MAG: EAL domain-containing protein [Gammaproteobacteria bacterium]